VCCSVLQYVAVCCSVVQCVAVCCSVLQCVAVCCSVVQCGACKALMCGLVYIYMHCTYKWICTCTAYKRRVRTQHDFLMQDDGVSCIDVRGSVYVEPSLLSGVVYYSELHWSAGQCICICNRFCISTCYRPCLPCDRIYGSFDRIYGSFDRIYGSFDRMYGSYILFQ